MTYNPAKHHRRSIRLKGYDYSSPGHYFITICTQNRACLFGEIVDGKMIMNDAGKMVDKWYFEIRNKFPKIKCDEYKIMPNHFHCIIEIPPVRMALCGHPESSMALSGHPESSMALSGHPESSMALSGHPESSMALSGHPESSMALSGHPESSMALSGHPESSMALSGHPSAFDRDTHAGVSLREIQRAPDRESVDERVSIFEILDWFKTMSTNEYIRGVKNGIWQRFEKRFWQLRYWDHIVRNEMELFTIRQYIKNNPSNWERDKLNVGTGNRVLEEIGIYGEESWMI
jgi:putative transposase